MADLAAQGSQGKTNDAFCERCFAPLGSSDTYCPDCGAPVGSAAPAADSAVHGELAQANLLRLRGDLDGSEKALLGILRRYPNDPHAHEMLGDVCAERGEIDRAKEWYELALDLSPDSADIRRKMENAGTTAEEQKTADTAETLGLPPTTPPAAWWPLAGAAALLVLAIAVAAWPKAAPPSTMKGAVSAPLAETTPKPAETVAETGPPPAPTPAPVGSEEERKLLTDLQGKPDGSHVQSVVLDPRTQAIVVTFDITETDDPHVLAINLGRETLEAAPAVAMVTLRALRAGSLAFAADLPRAGSDANDPLTNVWPVPTAPTTEPGTTPSTGPSSPTSGGTTPPIGSVQNTPGNSPPPTSTSGNTSGPTNP